MLTVGELRALLALLPADVPVGTMTITEQGFTVEHIEADTIGVDMTADNDGRPAVVWITSIPTNYTPLQPAFIAWPCPCGEIVRTSQGGPLPLDHIGHLNWPRP